MRTHGEVAFAAVARALEEGGDRNLFIVHLNADPDSVGSAIGLARAFGGDVGAPGGVSASGRRLAARSGTELLPVVHPGRYVNVVAVDTSSRVQLGDAARAVDPSDLVIVDHHAYGDLTGTARLAAVDASRESCAEVALRVIGAAGRAPDAAGAFALACGLVADSQRFRRGDAGTLRAFLALAEPHGFTVPDVVTLLEDEDEDDAADLSRRIAHLKAASRVTFRVHGGFLLAESRVGACEASSARGLVRLGADFAVVATERAEHARVSLRGSAALEAAGVHLGEIANAVGREHDWSGGGHAGAAGLNGRPPADTVCEAVKARVEGLLGARAGGA